MDITSRKDAKPIEDVCGFIQELYNSDNLSFSVATITGKSTSHKHEKMEEIYFVLKGSGILFIGSESSPINPGDLIPIPKNKFHHIETEANQTIEVIVATFPKYDPSDVIKEKS